MILTSFGGSRRLRGRSRKHLRENFPSPENSQEINHGKNKMADISIPPSPPSAPEEITKK